jgi:hypothetical protein
MFFFKSHDKKFILKTMTPGDLKETRRTLQHHYLHMSKEPASLISRIYGVFTIKMDAFSPVHVMIMENCLEEVPGYSLDHVFDIKGSEFSREVLKKTPSSVLEKQPSTGGEVLKDLDYIRLKAMRNFIDFSSEDWEKITQMISHDTIMLRNLGVMDYSLLLSIRRVKKDLNDSFEEIIEEDLDLEDEEDACCDDEHEIVDSIALPALDNNLASKKS